MKISIKIALFVFASALIISCSQEDPGPQQNEHQSFSILDFDRLEVADAMDVTVIEGNTFSVLARGDRRNLNDLKIYKDGSTLVAKYSVNRNRQYTTYLTITMPALHGFDFSGAVTGRVEDFDEEARMDVSLSGASVAQVDCEASEIYINLTGASQLRLSGEGKKADATVSGASSLSAFDFPVDEAKLIVSGASQARINASAKLVVTASGASDVLYRGAPQMESDVTGASTLKKD